MSTRMQTKPTLSPAQARLAEGATAIVESLRQRARNLDEAVVAFCAGRLSEEDLRRAMREAQS